MYVMGGSKKKIVKKNNKEILSRVKWSNMNDFKSVQCVLKNWNILNLFKMWPTDLVNRF